MGGLNFNSIPGWVWTIALIVVCFWWFMRSKKNK
jgi:hypothetical protein